MVWGRRCDCCEYSVSPRCFAKLVSGVRNAQGFIGSDCGRGWLAVDDLLCFFVLHSNATIAALFLLLGVVLAGTFASRVEAVAASVAATLCLDYFFIPPIWQISIADPQGWLALGVFLAVSLIATNLSARLRQATRRNGERQSEAEKLHALNRAILLSDAGAQDMQRIGEQMHGAFRV